MEPDRSDILSCQQGNPQAYESLVHRYQKRMISVAYQMLGDWEDAREAAQDAFVKAYQAIHAFDHSGFLFAAPDDGSARRVIGRIRRVTGRVRRVTRTVGRMTGRVSEVVAPAAEMAVATTIEVRSSRNRSRSRAVRALLDREE